MKSLKKTIAWIVLCILVTTAAIGSLALTQPYISESYHSFSGKITGITNGSVRRIMVEDASGNRMQFSISSDAYIDGSVKIQNGADIICFYNPKEATPKKAPATFSLEAAVGQSAAANVMLDWFDTDLVNEGNTLKLNNVDKAEVVSSGGEKYAGTIKNMKLLVFYGASTRSMPAQTSPTKIVVLADSLPQPAPMPTVPAEGPTQGGAYKSFEGKVVSVLKQGGITTIMLQDEDGAQTSFSVNENTVLLNGAKLTEGKTLIGFYSTEGIASAIFPPQYTASVIAAKTKGTTVFVGQFDEQLTSADGTLKIMSTKKTQITNVRGKKYTGTLENQTLAVVYKAATFSIPAQTTPSRIVVLPASK